MKQLVQKCVSQNKTSKPFQILLNLYLWKQRKYKHIFILLKFVKFHIFGKKGPIFGGVLLDCWVIRSLLKVQILVMYISTSVWVLCTPNTGQNMLFQWSLCRKAKNWSKIWQKSAYWVCIQTLAEGFISKKNLNGCNVKKHFLPKFAKIFFLFQLFMLKM